MNLLIETQTRLFFYLTEPGSGARQSEHATDSRPRQEIIDKQCDSFLCLLRCLSWNTGYSQPRLATQKSRVSHGVRCPQSLCSARHCLSCPTYPAPLGNKTCVFFQCLLYE